MKPINTSIFDFPELITGKYVLLIDEYDAPIAGLLDTEEGRRELSVVRKTLHDFYVQAKAQCGERRYADAYAADGRRVVYVGVNYDPAARTVGEVKTEPA